MKALDRKLLVLTLAVWLILTGDAQHAFSAAISVLPAAPSDAVFELPVIEIVLLPPPPVTVSEPSAVKVLPFEPSTTVSLPVPVRMEALTVAAALLIELLPSPLTIVEVFAPPTIVSLPVLPLRNCTVLLATTLVLRNARRLTRGGH